MNEEPDDDGPPRTAVAIGFLFVVGLIVLALYIVHAMMDACSAGGGRIC